MQPEEEKEDDKFMWYCLGKRSHRRALKMVYNREMRKKIPLRTVEYSQYVFVNNSQKEV